MTLAAVLEAWQLARRRPALAAATPVCLVAGAAGSVVASALGLVRNEFDGPGGNAVELHKWAALATTVFAVLAAVLLVKTASSASARFGCRLAAFAAAALAGGAGYLGGEMVFGRNHITRGLFTAKGATQPHDSEPAAPGGRSPAAQPATAATPVDFTRDIAPLLSESCLKCHGRGRVSGKLNLTTRAGAARGGGGDGAGLVPGQPGKSAIYGRITAPEDDARMPPPGQTPLTSDQIDLVRRWIEAGANWPEDAVLR